jgi:leucyl/phenylalanyl-tRNA--protein transferase
VNPPREPPPSRYILPDPTQAGPDDVVAIGGDLAPGTVLQAYRKGMFPMHLPDGVLAWWSPWRRGVLPIDGLKVSRSLRRSTRRFEVTYDVAFEDVVRGCADPSRPHGWITDEFQRSYGELHRLGWAHSVEVWNDQGSLVGGLYGIGLGGMFAGESMFHTATDASKVALVHLVERMRDREAWLLDVQWATPHLESLGAMEISRLDYLDWLVDALKLDGTTVWCDDSPQPGNR